MSLKILIVEDEAIISLTYQMGLDLCGYEVVGIASSADEALEMARDRHPDLLIIDIKLRGEMDGIALARIITQDLKAPIIFLTGNTDRATRESALKMNPLKYLEKPMESKALCAIIRQLENILCSTEK